MKKLSFILYLFICILMPINSESVVGFQNTTHNKGITFCIGTDLSLVTLQIGYTHSFYISEIDRNLVLDTTFSIPLMTPDLRDFRFKAGLKIDTLKVHKFLIPVSLKLIFRGNSNAAYNAFGIGTELGVFPGFYTDKFAVAGELLWDTELATHISFSDYYEGTIYPGAVSGWYGGTSNMFRFGGRFGGLIKERDEIYLRGGYEYHGNYNLKIPPFYAVLGNNIRF